MSTLTEIPASPATPTPDSDRELVFHRHLSAPPERIYAAWTRPELVREWFTPRPWTTPVAELDVRPGGASRIVMRGPDGNEFPNLGVYLEVVPNRRLVLTDAYVRAWVPAEKPFLTIDLTLTPTPDGGTDYTARIFHWSAADREKHEQMGFLSGWGQATDQLEALLRRG
ncbi:SRPBCC family protein [Opitutus sp. ER46]|uniref:SRPBCC family protein n=1 Tax=Opitutus sp. ER46 TaxID=2161864 RepID=UPI000D326479|nr:SRPBCC family protein [Opitutus sp. ER46]PTX92264.1 polyketide cyclase [Opitutus sp. ER46]